LWDVATGHELKTFKGHSNIVFSVAFSPDGKTLASGSVDNTIKIWEVSSGQELKTLKGHLDTVFSVAFSPNGMTLASGSFDRTIKLWDAATGQEMKTLKGHSHFVLSVAFSPDGKTLASGSHDDAIKIWDVSSGQELKTLKGNTDPVRSVAFSPDGKKVASGSSDNTIKLWDVASGLESRTLQGGSSVLFSPDGKILVSGGDTIKLWGIDSGAELARLIALDEKDWVVATPNGRFDGSPDGMKLISYMQDNKLLPLDSFFEQFYTPKLLQRVYAREVLPPTTSKVDFSKRIKLPPNVRIISPKPGAESNSDTAQIMVQADDQGGGVEDIRLYQNGKLLDDTTRQLIQDKKAKTRTFEVNLVPGVNTFRATAFNTDRTEAVPDEIKIEFKALEPSVNLYILAIGLNKYKNENYDLNYGHADAQAFADVVEQLGRGIFKQITKKVLFDADASHSGIEAAFNEIIKQAKPQDAFVFYFAGHGAMSEGDEKTASDFYLVPYDVVKIFGDSGSLTSNGIAARDLREMLKKVRALKQLIILDACQSGGAVETIAMRGPAEEKAIMQLARSAGVAVLASAGSTQSATEFGKLGHGVFTYALLEGLNGKADGSPMDGKITVMELAAYINNEVPELTKLYRGKRQDPNSSTRGQDFPIAIKQ
jgi:WD40 repeat protein